METKKVVNIVSDYENHSLRAIVQDVPQEYMECSISGEWLPRNEFEENGKIVRTNCTRTYNGSMESNKETKLKVAEFKKSVQYRTVVKECEKQWQVENNSMSICDVIAALQKLQAICPDARICATQNGYYADGGFASIHEPESIHGFKNLYSISHSSQNY